MKWWPMCISMVILLDSIFERQSETLATEAVTVHTPSHEEDLDDVGCNADLYAFKQGVFQGCSCSNHER